MIPDLSSSRRLSARLARAFNIVLLVALVTGLWATAPVQTARAFSSSLVISQIQVAGAVSADEFVEIHNIGSTPYDLDGHVVVYRSAAGASDNTIAAFTGVGTTVIPAGGYLLLAHVNYDGTVLADVPFGTLADLGLFSASGGGMAIRLGDVNSGTIIDSIGYGSATNAFVEMTAETAPNAHNSAARLNSGCTDTDNNALDFQISTPAAPRNLASPVHVCETPAPQIDSQPVDPTNQTTAEFTFSAPAPGYGFQCALDGGAYVGCTSPATYNGLAHGPHTFAVSLSVNGVLVGAPGSYAWNIDTVLPTVTIDSQPANPTQLTDASFTFSGSDGSGSGLGAFECKLDAGAFAACTSPKDYTGLAEGSHTFAVRVSDLVGNLSTQASYTWLIDTTGPNVTIDSQPANPTKLTSASFAFSGSGVSAFECKLDGGVFAACTSPKSYTSLADGSHTFVVRGSDMLGNIGPETSYTWVIDTVIPTVQITGQPANPTNLNDASFAFTGNGTGSGLGAFECKLDAGTFAACTSPKNYPSLADGSHTFVVRVSDLAGNLSAEASYTWLIDTTGPNVAIDSQPANPTKLTSASFAFSGSGVSAFECKLDGGVFAACTSPKSYTSLADGSHTFVVRGSDMLGNNGPETSYTWVIDTVIPTVQITGKPANPTKLTDASFAFTGNGTGSGLGAFECKLDAGTFAACTSPKNYPSLADGSHTFVVRVSDLAGNLSAEASVTWLVDTVLPTVQITSQPANLTRLDEASFAFTGSGTGSGLGAFECKLDTGAWGACTSPKSYTSLADGSHTFAVRVYDLAGNLSTEAGYTWQIDATLPTVTIDSQPANPTYLTSASFAFTGSDIGSGLDTFECQLDAGAWGACTSPQSYTSLAQGSHTFAVRAYDLAGNVGTPASYTWSIDLTNPVVLIESKPANPTNQASASFTFSGSGGTSALSAFECQLDSGAWATCTSPKKYTGLADGSHTFAVRAYNREGHVSVVASFTWLIDATGPAAPVLSDPADNSFFSYELNQPTFTGTAEAGATVNVWLIDGAARASSTLLCTATADTNGQWSCQSEISLAEGPHSVVINAVDALGNPGPYSPAITFTIEFVRFLSVIAR